MIKKQTIEPIKGNFKNKDILSLDQFSPSDISILFKRTKTMREIGQNARPSDILKGNIVTLIFFEPSSRTFGSFSAAVKQLGGATVEIQDPQHSSSVSKGETLEDTIRVFEAYCDAIVIRHPDIGSAEKAAQAAKFVPIINAGDGAGEHPTQALLDLYTIYEKYGKIDGIKGLICADALYGRGVHSLLKAFGKYKKVTIYLLAPKEVRLTKKQIEEYTKTGLKLIEIHSEEEIPKDCDFWYWSRLQKERYVNLNKNIKMFRLDQKLIDYKARKDMIIMHILPRIDEVDIETDSDPRVIYLSKQIRNGMYVRMALLSLILGK